MSSEQLSKLGNAYCNYVDGAQHLIPNSGYEFDTSSQSPQKPPNPGLTMPPHLKLPIGGTYKDIPDQTQRYNPAKIFHHNSEKYAEIKRLVIRFKANSSLGITDYRDPKKQMKHYWRYNKDDRLDKTSIGDQPNVGDRPDWYSDAIFGQQFFTGPNPTSIERANAEWLEKFRKTALKQKKPEVAELLAGSDEFYVVDYSGLRTSLGIEDKEPITAGVGLSARYGCASVALFRLAIHKETQKGRLHPLAIILDYKGSIENSVVIFNQRHSPEDSTKTEKTDWPWRYAKTCVMVSDWAYHEIVVHLINTHLVEEVAIVAAHRAFKPENGIFRLLKAHWDKTLALNLAARQILIPAVIIPISPFPEEKVYEFINKQYRAFDWEKKTIPNDLEARGFSAEGDWDTPKFHNYGYARNMRELWPVLTKFVTNYLDSLDKYKTNEEVSADPEIKAWVHEMKGPGQLKTFPDIRTREQLIEALVMCIHIASPQHTAINYLQNYYQSFVAAKPPALYQPLPQTLSVLLGYKEDDLVKSLPILGGNHWRLASYLPYLLSLRNEADMSLVTYAQCLAYGNIPNEGIKKAGATLKDDLQLLSENFDNYSLDLDAIERRADCPEDLSCTYTVLNPENTPASILI